MDLNYLKKIKEIENIFLYDVSNLKKEIKFLYDSDLNLKIDKFHLVSENKTLYSEDMVIETFGQLFPKIFWNKTLISFSKEPKDDIINSLKNYGFLTSITYVKTKEIPGTVISVAKESEITLDFNGVSHRHNMFFSNTGGYVKNMKFILDLYEYLNEKGIEFNIFYNNMELLEKIVEKEMFG